MGDEAIEKTLVAGSGGDHAGKSALRGGGGDARVRHEDRHPGQRCRPRQGQQMGDAFAAGEGQGVETARAGPFDERSRVAVRAAAVVAGDVFDNGAAS